MALSRVVNRPLHVLSGSGQVALTVIDETTAGAAAAGVPVQLLRSEHEYGCAHYDLVEQPVDA
eukprot:m.154926 g.154926  ORF g.154926 m.154926 type:complete len:63 (+) comp11719_c0_seq16:5184-5372(+)